MLDDVELEDVLEVLIEDEVEDVLMDVEVDDEVEVVVLPPFGGGEYPTIAPNQSGLPGKVIRFPCNLSTDSNYYHLQPLK